MSVLKISPVQCIITFVNIVPGNSQLTLHNYSGFVLCYQLQKMLFKLITENRTRIIICSQIHTNPRPIQLPLPLHGSMEKFWRAEFSPTGIFVTYPNERKKMIVSKMQMREIPSPM